MNAPGSSNSYQDAEALFQQAVDLPASARAGFLLRHCGANFDLRRDVETLLRHYVDAPATFLSPARSEGLRGGPAVPLPRRIGNYEIVGLIGRGGMGVVYEGRQENPRRNVAVKAIRAELATPEVLRRFEYEAEILARLQHPGIAHVYEAGVGEVLLDDGAARRQPFFAMELVRGAPLNRYLEQRRPELRERLALFARICDAVEHAHQKGVIHRDLKPANILVDAQGAPKILDFGIARASEADPQLPTMHTHAAQLLGTVPYMSPEQINGQTERIDTRSDVYALGVVLYEMLAGCLPYDATTGNLAAAARVINEQIPKPLGTANRACRGELETIARKALEKEPARRYASVHALGADVRRYLAGDPIEARRASAWYVLRKLLARNRLSVGSAAVLLLGLIVTSIAASALAIERGGLLARHQLRFDQVRELSRVLFDVHPKIEKLAGATPARKFLIDAALHYFDSLARDAGDDPGLQTEIAEGYGRLAALQGNPNYVNIGDSAGALQSYQKCIDWSARLAEREPGALLPQRLVGQAHAGMGDIFDQQGRMADAEAAYRRSHEIAGALTVAHTETIEPVLDLALSHIKLAAMQEKQGDGGAALTHRIEALRLLEEAVAREPAHEKARIQLGVAHLQLGDSHSRQGAASAALQSYRSSLELRRALLAGSPTNVDFQRSVAIAAQRVGNAQGLPTFANTGEGAQARESFLESLALFEQLARADAQDARAQRDLSVAHEKIGVLALNAQDWSEARARFERCLDIRRRLVELDPSNAGAESDLAISYGFLGRALAGQGEFEPAREALEAAIARAESLHQRDPRVAPWARTLALHQYYLGALHAGECARPEVAAEQKLLHWQAAAERHEAALTLVREMEERGILAPTDARLIPMFEGEVEKCRQAIANMTGAARGVPADVASP